jgi:hypothetical protein
MLALWQAVLQGITCCCESRCQPACMHHHNLGSSQYLVTAISDSTNCSFCMLGHDMLLHAATLAALLCNVPDTTYVVHGLCGSAGQQQSVMKSTSSKSNRNCRTKGLTRR